MRVSSRPLSTIAKAASWPLISGSLVGKRSSCFRGSDVRGGMLMKPQSDQQGLETENQVVNIIRHLNERWEQRLTLDNLRLAERYVKGELHLLIHFRVGGVTEEYAALLKRKLPISGPQEALNAGNFSATWGGHSL